MGRSHLHSEEAKFWKQVKLGDVCRIQGGMQPPKSVFKYEPLVGETVYDPASGTGGFLASGLSTGIVAIQ
ncbi:hypothetical protein [Geminocystis sp. GBBB08]|uniref:hypothetical protein n=1 Tax=Geminocystis sp. GBBB08 TaxID=2604140 RepID=UPI0027E28498|nr:hypothetical protein [Geminocystis sp. GBBB08]MBL1210325.1 hypothetical protein [Geminocystis sp. GBBB08]